MKFQNNYKGKWFILSDEEDEVFGDIGTIEEEDLTDEFLRNHVENCMYYGIPCYIGSDDELKKRIKEIETEYEEAD